MRGETGWRALTRREREVPALACDGCLDGQIAARLSIEPTTVKEHMRHIYRKIGVPIGQGFRGAIAVLLKSGELRWRQG